MIFYFNFHLLNEIYLNNKNSFFIPKEVHLKMENKNGLFVFILILLNYLKEKIISFIYSFEIVCLLKIKFGLKEKERDELNDIDYSYIQLNKVSRSFALVIQQLPEKIKDIVCIFYLVLRGLDTIEDDMIIPLEQKIHLLNKFHENLFIKNWSIENIGDTKDSRILLENFHRILNVFQLLDRKYQNIIVDITKQMSDGMIHFLNSNDSIETIDEYNLYCHYVAGLVGHGLSQIFYQSQFESKYLVENPSISNSMGLFLQKTNIIRDYLEDLQAGRIWWPKQIWINYSSDFHFFQKNPSDDRSIQCLNEMIYDAFNHLPDVIQYLRLIENRQIFEFCAIPQLMALATLEQLYSNPLVFTSVVKIRKGLSAKIIYNSSNIHQINQWIQFFISKLRKKTFLNKNLHHKSIYQLIEQIQNLST